VASALRFHQPVTGTVSLVKFSLCVSTTPCGEYRGPGRKATLLGYFMEAGGQLQLHASTADRRNRVVCTAALSSGSHRFKSGTRDELS
jgi:hypothetical protein